MGNYKNFGVMLDVSRNGVMKVSKVKEYIDYLVLMGYNTLELYAEDTYEIEGEPYFGYLRGAYTSAEIKEIDAYAQAKGVELIPCVQTLAHFTNMRKLPHYAHLFDCDDILLIDSEEVYAFLDKMFQSLANNFTSRQVNIGMDEAHNVGLGKFLEKHGYQNRSEMLVRHLNRVSEIAQKYGFTCHMWSDMFFRLISGGGYCAEELKGVHVSPEIAAKVPQNVALTYWDYYATEREKYDIMFDKHFEFGREVWFAGGAWAWQGFAPMNGFSLKSMRLAMESVREKGVKNVLITVWGDNGKECSYFAVLPSLFAIRQFAEGNFDMEDIKAKFKAKFGQDFDGWMTLDLPHELYVKGEKQPLWDCLNATMFYTDPFLGLRDCDYAALDPMPFAKYAKEIAKAGKKAGEFSYIFDVLSKLCNYLEYKAPMGIVSRKVYREGSKKDMKKLIAYYGEAVKALDTFTKAYREQWFKENKAFGWEVQEIRIGGIRARILGCQARLQAYLDGKLDRIEELGADVLPNEDRNGFMYHMYCHIASPSEI